MDREQRAEALMRRGPIQNVRRVMELEDNERSDMSVLERGIASGLVSVGDIAMLEAQGILTKDEARTLLGISKPEPKQPEQKAA